MARKTVPNYSFLLYLVILIRSFFPPCCSYAGTRSQRGLDMRDTDLELEYAGKFTADEEREAHPELGSFGGDGFLESTGYPYYSSGSVLTPVKFGAAQRVPETPALTGALRSIPPDTEDCRLNFSCKLVACSW